MTLSGDILTIENSRMARRFRFKGGNLASVEIVDKASGARWGFDGCVSDLALPGEACEAEDGQVSIRRVPVTPIAPAHQRVEVTCRLGSLMVRRAFRIYDDCPAIATELYLRGRPAAATWRGTSASSGDLVNAETVSLLERRPIEAPRLDRVEPGGRHLRITVVRFMDITDYRNTLVQEQRIAPYVHPCHAAGNLLLATDALGGGGFFLLKESPCSDVQLASPGFDFVISRQEIGLVGIGAEPADIAQDRWTRCYGCVIGIGRDERQLLAALRQYQHNLRRYDPARDSQILLNTWGDRSKDTKISEAFCLAELEAARRLGVTHFMIDDGWQTGRTANWAGANGQWAEVASEDFWQPNPQRFPRGLEPVVQRAAELGIRLGLWFGLRPEADYAGWRESADAILRLHRRYGIDLFKIDMVNLATRAAEENFRAMLDAVMEASAGRVSFNLDVTASRRGGYHMFKEYGSLFVENRYTDWGNYYPHWTLRNLWMLSRYVPPQFLQFEFLNRWRNAAKYAAGDPLAPANVPFDYCFAITMFAQPLAWFEATGLPDEAFALADLIRVYRDHDPAIHRGMIFPIGQEPDGTAWTGFQSCSGEEGYLLVFREYNRRPQARLQLWGITGSSLALDCIAGRGRRRTARLDRTGEILVSLPGPHTFALYRYRVTNA